jgi:hypothetical protein
MDSLTINKLSPSINDKLEYKISNLVDMDDSSFIKEFDAKILIRRKKDKLKKKKKSYDKILNDCLRKIMQYDDNDKTDMIYEIKYDMFRDKKFNNLECIYFLQKNLREKLFDTTLISSNKIFITWKYMEIDNTKSIKIIK